MLSRRVAIDSKAFLSSAARRVPTDSTRLPKPSNRSPIRSRFDHQLHAGKQFPRIAFAYVGDDGGGELIDVVVDPVETNLAASQRLQGFFGVGGDRLRGGLGPGTGQAERLQRQIGDL